MEKYSVEPYEDSQDPSDFRTEEAYMRAKKRVDAMIGFYWHLAVYIVINIALILIIGLNSGLGFTGFGTYATAFFWGIGLIFHFIGVFGFNFILGKDWEQRKIKEYMDKERQQWD